MWFLEKNFYSIELNSSQIFRYIGQITGVLAINFLGLNYLLSTRFRFIENILGGLDKLYRVHIYTGLTAFVLLLAHPVFLSIQNIEFNEIFRSYFIPYESNALALNLGIAGFWFFLAVLFFASNRKVSYTVWKIVHGFIGIPLLIISAHIVLAGKSYEYIPLEMWTSTWILIGIFSYVYKLFLYDHIGPVLIYTVEKIDKTEELFEIFLRPVDKSLKFKAGQFAFLQFLGSKISMESHPFTISSEPSNSMLKFSIKKLGDWTNKLDLLEVEDKVKVAGPYGHFHTDNLRKSKKQIWIGGGIGVTPFLSMAKDQKYCKNCEDIYLIYSDNTRNQAVFIDEVKSYDSMNENLRTILHISDDQGFLNADQIEKWVGGIEDTVFLICGPKPMRDALYKQLRKKGVKDSDIVFELFNFK